MSLLAVLAVAGYNLSGNELLIINTKSIAAQIRLYLVRLINIVNLLLKSGLDL